MRLRKKVRNIERRSAVSPEVYTKEDQKSTVRFSMARTFHRMLWRILLVIVGVLLTSAWYVYLKDYASDFLSRKGELLEVREQPAGEDSIFARSWITLRSSSGMVVECGMLRPIGGRTRSPAIIVLGGKVTGKHAIDYAQGISDVILVAVDYPYEPRASYSAMEFLHDVPEMREALFDMVPSVMLLTDYLWTRTDVDTMRLVILGYSFGAQLVPAIFAHDRRPAIAAMVYGGGDLHGLIRHNVRRYKDALTSEVAAALGAFLLHPLEPLRYVREIFPRPLIMLNGSMDEQIPRESPELLFKEALEPKKIIWLQSGHVHPKGVELRRQIIDTLKTELSALGVSPAGEP